MKHLQSKISRSLVVYLLLFSSCITLILTVIQLRIDFVHDINNIQQRLEQISLTNLDVIKQSVWTMDTDALKVQLDGLQRLPDIIRVELTDANNHPLLELGSIDTDNIIPREYPIYQNYKETDILIGTLRVVATKENAYQRLIDTTIVILISQGIKTFLVSLFVLIIFYYLVTRHILRIAEFSENANIDMPDDLLVIDRKIPKFQRGDEIDHLVTSLNKMIGTNRRFYNELRKNQKLLEESQSNFVAIFDSITDVLVFADNNRKIIKVNPAMSKIFGYDENELIGKTTEILYANKDEYLAQGKLRYHNGAELSASVYEINYKRKDGSIFPSETLGGKVQLHDGTHIGYLGIIRDISLRKQAEEENRHLQNALQQAQKMEAIGNLAGGIAHDFNNILASIIGYGELALIQIHQSNDDKLFKYLKNIVNSGERGKKLVAQMMAFSRSSAQEVTPINLDEVLTEAIEILKPSLSSGINITTSIADNLPAIMFDKTQMHQVILNLCINARDAMQNQGDLHIVLNIDTNVLSKCDSCGAVIQGDYVTLKISDTGSGIDPDIQSRIFEPFVTNKEVGKGTGMGLSVVHGILHRHNCHISVESIPKTGTTFTVYMPRTSLINANKVTDSEASRNIRADQGKDKHILVVDDEEMIATYLKNYLETYGYSVTTVNDSTEALKLIKNAISNFDLLITDQTMPNLMGDALAREAISLRPDFPVIICSGYNDRINEATVKDMGRTCYLSKPINHIKLLNEIKSLTQS